MITRFLIPLFALALALPATAQQAPGPLQTTEPPRAWIGLGTGLGHGAGSAANVSAGANITIGRRTSAWVGQVAANGNWSTESRPENTERPYATHAGLSLGRVWTTSETVVAGFAGPALGWERARSGPTYRAPGLLLGAQFFITPTEGLGLGLDAFAFAHPDRPQLGVRVAIQIGNAWTP